MYSQTRQRIRRFPAFPPLTPQRNRTGKTPALLASFHINSENPSPIPEIAGRLFVREGRTSFPLVSFSSATLPYREEPSCSGS